MTSNTDPSDQGSSLISHLVELRSRIIRSLLILLGFFLLLAPFSNTLYEILAQPLMQSMPEGTTMIATEPHTPFFIPFKFSFAVAIACAIPYLLYQLWAFIAPALYRHEKRLVVPLMISSSLLFYCGIVFAYFVVFPIIFNFFLATAPEGVTVATDIGAYLSFVLKLFFAFGIAFEVPVLTLLLIYTGTTSAQRLARFRPYIIVIAFVVGMLLTPPDIFSQTMLALPVWLLFELGLYCSRFLPKRAQAEEHSTQQTP